MLKIRGSSFENLCFLVRVKFKLPRIKIPNEHAKIYLWNIILFHSLYLDQENLFYSKNTVAFIEGYEGKNRLTFIHCNIQPLWFKCQRPDLQCAMVSLVHILHTSLLVTIITVTLTEL